jgi:hypothetical protein
VHRVVVKHCAALVCEITDGIVCVVTRFEIGEIIDQRAEPPLGMSQPVEIVVLKIAAAGRDVIDNRFQIACVIVAVVKVLKPIASDALFDPEKLTVETSGCGVLNRITAVRGGFFEIVQRTYSS